MFWTHSPALAVFQVGSGEPRFSKSQAVFPNVSQVVSVKPEVTKLTFTVTTC